MLVALERELTQDTELHCMGGFVLAEYYGLVRATGDVDVLKSTGTDKATIARLAGRGSPLHKRHRVYIDIGTTSYLPSCRNIDRDREDVVALARGPGLDIDVLRQRYQEELRPKLGRPEREDLTLRLWIEIIEELRGGA